MKKIFLFLSAVSFFFLTLCACENNGQPPANLLSTSQTENTEATQPSESVANTVSSVGFDEGKIDTYIYLNDHNTTISGEGVTFENNTVTISKGGTFSLSGKLSDGKIYINSNDEEKKVKLYLDGVDIYCSDDAPLFVQSSPRETILILADKTENVFSDNPDRSVPAEETDYANASIFSRDDLQIEGTGSLTVKGNFEKGIVSKDDLQIRGGNITVTSKDDAIRGKDSVEISEGVLNLTSSADGISTSNEEEEKGFILISGGNINIISELDAIDCVGEMTVSGGVITAVTSGGASEDMVTAPQEAGNRGFFGGMMPGKENQSVNDSTPSTKALKAGSDIKISGGKFNLNSVDDSIHSNKSVEISGGEFNIKSNDDAIHSEYELNISGGKIDIDLSYEGLESQEINISGGNINLIASDDAVNASAAKDQSENPAFSGETTTKSENADPWQPGGFTDNRGGKGGRPGGPGGMGDPMGEYDSNCCVNISGGNIVLNASGDGLDSNGDVTINGGFTVVYGPTNSGNGALDYAGSCTVNKGTLLAVGSSGMAQTASDGEAPSINFTCGINSNTLLTVTDSKGTEIISFISPKQYSCVVFSSDLLTKGETYKIYSGGSHSGEAVDGIYSASGASGNTLLGQLTAG